MLTQTFHVYTLMLNIVSYIIISQEYYIKLGKMSALDWRKAATLVSQHTQEATTAETDHLNSMPLSKLSVDDSSPPVVHYGSHVPLAPSTPKITATHAQSSPQEDSHQEIIPGILQGSLYPT